LTDEQYAKAQADEREIQAVRETPMTPGAAVEDTYQSGTVDDQQAPVDEEGEVLESAVDGKSVAFEPSPAADVMADAEAGPIRPAEIVHATPADLAAKIKAGDVDAAVEAVDRMDEQYSLADNSPKAVKARAARKKLVEDFGDKIGGARKDMARPLGPRGKKQEDLDDDGEPRPGWKNRYSVGEIVSSMKPGEKGKWSVTDKKKTDWLGNPRQIGTFDTKEEAERAIPLAEVSRNHSITSRGKDDAKEYVIYRKVSDRKRPVVKGGFKSYEEAQRYMAGHPEEVIEHKFPRYETYQYLDRVERVGGKERKGNVSPKDFQNEFGFRGGEFGNWQSGQDGQESLNHAYEALSDLSDVLGMPPKSVALNGDLAIAFGARGTGGKDAARAHYEPAARVINLTKMHGAGTLAHEWAHALDNHFARMATPEGKRIKGFDNVSDGLPHDHKLRPEAAEAWKDLIAAMTSTQETETAPVETAKQERDRSRKYVADRIEAIEKRHAESVRYWNDTPYRPAKGKRGKDFTPEQRKQWDELKSRLVGGDVGKTVWVEGSDRNRFGGYQSYEVLQDMNKLYKQVTGHSFHTADKSSDGANLYWSVKHALDAESRIGSDEARTKTVRKPTKYFQAARKMDEERVKDYYQQPTEMLSRAFEAYVHDKLADQKRKSDYLTGKADNRFYKMFDMEPFPEGEERERINTAFDKLFATMKHEPRKDEKGEHIRLYSAERSGATPERYSVASQIADALSSL
jgi:hypothetical protein